MNSPKEANQPIDGSSSKQGSNLADRPILSVSVRLANLIGVVTRKLSRLERVIEAQPDLQTITVVIKLDKRGRPRTVLIRTEAKSELNA